MVRALRRIRARLLADGQTGRYLRYALGEMVLVVAGILIALQLNTANQRRVEQQRVREYVVALVGDLSRDLGMLAPIQREMAYLRHRIALLGDYVRDTPIEELDNLRLFILMRAPYYRPYTWNTAALEQMKSSGMLGRMEDQELAARLSTYAALQRHLLDDYAHDRELCARALSLAHRVVDMNYPTLENWVSPEQLKTGVGFVQFEEPLIAERLLAELQEHDLDMLSRDPAMLGEAVNAYQRLTDDYGLWPRVRVEMVHAETMNRELQRDLCAAYGIPPPKPGAAGG